MPLIQLIYASHPFGFDDLALTGILASARRHNIPAGITGALICREDVYIQMLEGEGARVQSAFERIARDNRHTDVALLWSGPAEERLFPDWAMRHDPAQSWMWSREDVSEGAIAKASQEEARAIFTRLASSPPSVPQTCPMHA